MLWLALETKKLDLLLPLTEQNLPVVPMKDIVPRGKRYMCDGATAVPSSSSLHMFLMHESGSFPSYNESPNNSCIASCSVFAS